MSLTPQTAPVILGFGHTARSGKGECVTTIFNTHSREHGGQYDIMRIAFGDALRREIHEAMFTQWETDHPFDPNDDSCSAPSPQALMENLCKWAGVPYDPDAKPDELNPFGKQRKLQQWWGTEYRRNQDPFYWVRKVEEAIEARNPQIVLIDDLRFPNEYNFVEFCGGCKVKVLRPGFQGLTPEQAAHYSEHALDGYDFDYTIEVADGHLDELKAEALHVFSSLIKKHDADNFDDIAGALGTDQFAAKAVSVP